MDKDSSSKPNYTVPSSSDEFVRLLEKIALCTEVIQEIHYKLESDMIKDPERKADMLIAIEGLTFESLDLLSTTKYFVWGPEDEEEIV